MSNIKVMDEHLSNKIAAGEVVEKCVSIVKELVENAIDAKSSEIRIYLKEWLTALFLRVDIMMILEIIIFLNLFILRMKSSTYT